MRTLLVLLCFCISACASTRMIPIVYEPSGKDTLIANYTNGLPIIAVAHDSLNTLFSLEYVTIANTGYFRLWLLVTNNASSPYLLDPSKSVLLDFQGRLAYDEERTTIEVAPPSKILASIDEAEMTAQISRNIGGFLQARASHVQTPDYARFSDLREISNWYPTFKSSTNAGILRKNTIAPGTSVNGYVYFLASLEFPSGTINYTWKTAKRFRHQIIFTLRGTPKVINLIPVPGE